MINKKKHKHISYRESLLLPRIIESIKNNKVLVTLNNGLNIVGFVESYGKKVKTLKIHQALEELSLFTKSTNFNKKLNEIIEFYYEKYNLQNCVSRNVKFFPDFKSFVILTNCSINYNKKNVKLSKVSINESNIAVLTPIIRESETDKSNHVSNKLLDIKNLILTNHMKEIKREGYLKCDRLGKYAT
ncbi:uncharacterized protein TA07705 [Theileria annulata]|uniref:Uncharacterized protein n=1 Tax=Theileria annulata TaxID=5874 RepID=Q4UA09_THEAN|nr:uncharacterized protein TA07705 [Theileria annulata]CAI76344.1 hypothetical protein TA07705 [Theileria annulata]|eukprot:XP_952968.1 hypothetical protein TA07705 [Theileria annulata]